MQISFFEEFPTTKNLSKLNLISWPTKIYLAARSWKEFNQLKSRMRQKNVKEMIYWPILEINEGYWISPFSFRQALQRIFGELKGKRVPVMLDLELPTTRNPWLYLTQGLNFFKNKRLIQKFIENYAGQVYLAEYYPPGKLTEQILEFFGLHYQNKRSNIIKLIYHSMHKFNEEFICDEMKQGRNEGGERFLAAYGTIARGIQRNEPILSLKQLNKDLELANLEGIKEVIIYRLGGLNKNYVNLLKQF
ncbi:hypothetical protein J4207_05185 [Candidatus Woesearchaeota archaeon]|nr:hypothetical protein [Candidatus Woesearchaeota archaeon]HLC80456.1 hypothetical protein [Candidatus Nanoarchaeia archaeon]